MGTNIGLEIRLHILPSQQMWGERDELPAASMNVLALAMRRLGMMAAADNASAVMSVFMACLHLARLMQPLGWCPENEFIARRHH
jgi:hypothetical protein